MTAEADAAAWKHLERKIAAMIEERQSESAFALETGTAYVSQLVGKANVSLHLVPKY
jgi:hypothetical protein